MPVARRKLAVLALGAIGLAAALTASAFVAPAQSIAAAPTYTPTDPARVVARVPPRDPAEVRARAALAAAPERVELAVALAQADVQRGRALEDPRYFGHAEATLARWWRLPSPPLEVQRVRATIAVATHDFVAARADLDALVELHADDALAHLARAAVAIEQADYAAARDSCAAVARVAPALVAATCVAPLDGLAHPAEAAATLAAVLDANAGADPGVRGWALATLGALAVQEGDDAAATARDEAAVALDADDHAARAALADVYLHAGRAREASQLLAGREAIDSLLVRRAIAEHLVHGPDDAALVAQVRARIATATARGDRTQLREHTRFVLAVDGDAAAALALAKQSWAIEHDLVAARVLAEAASEARDAEAAAPVRAWRLANHVDDAQLARALGSVP